MARRLKPNRRLLAIAAPVGVVIAAVLLFAVSDGAKPDSAHKCVKGQPSETDVSRTAPGGPELSTPVFVVACGAQGPAHPFQIVAYGVGESICISVDRPRDRETRIVLCKPKEAQWLACGQAVVCTEAPGYIGNSSGPRTEISGEMNSEPASVQIAYRRNGRKRTRTAAFGRIDGNLLEKLGIKEAGGVFVAAISGCVPSRSVVAVAESADHQTLTRQHVRPPLPKNCQPRNSSSGGFQLFVES